MRLAARLGAATAAAVVVATASGLEDRDPATLAAAAIVGGALTGGAAHRRAVWIIVALATIAGGTWTLALAAAIGAHALLAARSERLPFGLAAAAALGAALVVASRMGDAVVPGVLIVGAGWAVGRALRVRERLLRSLDERARELEAEQELHVALSVRYERAQVAVELHDIVAHAVSVMVIQASAGRRLAGRDSVRTTAALDAIAGAARQAQVDTGRLVALLSDAPATDGVLDLGFVRSLADGARASGLPVTLRVDPACEHLPTVVLETTCRVVREGLTNALRYAAGAPVAIGLERRGDAVTVSVENGAAGPEGSLQATGLGSGLHGLRARVAEAGGSFQAGPAADGGWRLVARLPARAQT